MKLSLRIKLISDATFGRGDGVAGVIDTEIEQDTETGLPCIKGRTLRGLIVEECANLLEAIRLQHDGRIPAQIEAAAQALFGTPGSTEAEGGVLHVGTAQFPPDLRDAVRQANLSREETLAMTTCVRRQTAMDESTDAPLANSLRSQRALVRNTQLEAPVWFLREPAGLELPLVAAAVRCVRRGGTGRNRGRGALESQLCDTQGKEVETAELFRFLAGWTGDAETALEVNG